MNTKAIFMLGIVAAFLLPGISTAADTAKKPRVKYVPPEGFAGHAWGELRSAFTQLPNEPIGVGAAWITGVEKEVAFQCITTANGECDFYSTLNSLQRTFEGGGMYVLSEYTIEDQGARFGNEKDGLVLHPVVYQFCANWKGTKREVPPTFDEINKFCGVRLMFKSESREELRGKSAEYVTRYDRMLEKLIAKFGKPANFAQKGTVVIETLEAESKGQADRKFRIYRWCPANDTKGFHTNCVASVTLALDPATGVGTVLYATPVLWEFAYAREKNKTGDRLYKMLHARK
jgi:hypothetical protein